MGHHSYLRLRTALALWCRDSYYPDVAALFSEDDRFYRPAPDPEKEGAVYGYATTIRGMAERLDAQGITADSALRDLEAGLTAWLERYTAELEKVDPPVDIAAAQREIRLSLGLDPNDLGDLEADGATRPQQSTTHQEKNDLPPADSAAVERELRFLLSSDPGGFEDMDHWNRQIDASTLVDRLHWEMDTRSLVRLLVHWSPDQDEALVLDLSELTGCCVELDPGQPIAQMARDEQLQTAVRNLPLVVITEGSTDAHLLSEGLKVTHPHLVGFIRFFDYGTVRPPSGIAGAVGTFKGFVAAGIGNRFILLADNDAAAHGGLAKLKRSRWPADCRILHYPDLPLLQAYPTYDPANGTTAVEDVNGRAGSLEMYFGQDVLTDSGGNLMPIHWKAVDPSAHQLQGSLTDADKRTAQQRFEAKLKTERSVTATGTEDWSGIRAVIDLIVRAFQ
ncbi:HEPN/Toprim-associated domain-containing protein [Kitasatospora sp. NPDC088548]|uniref:HEPN/Toprim-associated domain-containing protein n=1 Tax=Kitasatospora sp. NPDC088548 TaxID=3364075 RepID=UPI003824D052